MPWQEPPRDSAHRLQDLVDASARGYSIRLACRCGRTEILSAHALWWHCRKRRLSERLRDLPRRCRCTACGRRGPKMELTYQGPTSEPLPNPPLDEWKAELRRSR